MAEFLLEFFSEEIPARMQRRAMDDLKRLLEQEFKNYGLSPDSIESFVTPRRLTAVVRGLVEVTPGKSEERRGPRLEAPDAALQGFFKAASVTREQCEQRDGYWYAKQEVPAQQTVDIIPDIVRTIIAAFPWAKSMRWPQATQTWIRPLRSILCVFAGKSLEFQVDSVGLVTGNQTAGHRFLAPELSTINSFEDYKTKLEKAFVILDHSERQVLILKSLQEQASVQGLILQEDEGLLEEVAGLSEYPVCRLGKIDLDFMGLPKEVLSTAMRVHQKYFTLLNKDGTLAPFFGVVTNILPSDGGTEMIRGYERVLRARLSDAVFFYKEDQKIPLEDLTSKLAGIIFQARLGTVGQKIERLQEVMNSASGKKAAALCKADLMTNMVGEFPELQGIMGEIYARIQGIDPVIAQAIREHYQPQGPLDRCPSNALSIELAMADKIDTLVGFFGIGEEPTGSKDPYALRRAALGIIRLIRENALKDFRFNNLLEKSLKTYQTQGVQFKESTTTDRVFDFILDRLKVALRAEGLRHDCVSAVVDGSQKSLNPAIKYNLWSLAERSKALHDFLETSDGHALQSAFRRANGILMTEQKKDNKSYTGIHLSSKLLLEPQELTLFSAVENISKEAEPLLEKHDYASLMVNLSQLRSHVDAFFDLKVNDDNPEVRLNRLELLGLLVNQTSIIADFSKIEG